MSTPETQFNVPPLEDVPTFAHRIRTKTGAYDDVPDDELVGRWLKKFPVYRDRVDLGDDVVRVNARVPSDDAPPVADVSSPLPRIPQTAGVQSSEATFDRAHPANRIRVDVGLPEGFSNWGDVPSQDVAKKILLEQATKGGVDPDYAKGWIEHQAKQGRVRLYSNVDRPQLGIKRGDTLETADILATPDYDAERRTITVLQELPQVEQMRAEYERDKGSWRTIVDSWKDPSKKPGESFFFDTVPSAVDLATRPLQAASVGVAGVQRAAGAGIAKSFGEPEATRIVDEGTYSGAAIPRAMWGKFTTGKTPEHYEQPIALAADLALQNLDADNKSRLIRPAVRMVTETVGDPVNVAMMGAPSVRGILNVARRARAGESVLGAVRAAEEIEAAAPSIIRDAPVPERPHTIAAQMEALQAGRRKAVLITSGEDVPEIPRGFVATETHKGTFIHDPKRVSMVEVRAHVERNADGALLGHVGPKGARTTVSVVARDAKGREIQTSLSTPENVGKQVHEFHKQYPKARIEVGDLTDAGHVIDDRVAGANSQPFTLKENIYSALGVPRSIISSGDISSLRQGAVLASGHPVRAASAFKAQLKAFASEKAARRAMDAIKNDSLYEVWRKAGLFLPDLEDARLTTAMREETMPSRFTKHIPLVRRSERAFNTFLNKLRFDVAKDLYQAHPDMDTEELKKVAQALNVMTGRGSLPGALEKHGADAAQILFAPRLLASRIQTPGLLFSRSRVVRREAARNLVAFTGANIGFLGLAKLSGADVELDPRSTDFLRARFGNTRVDLGAGYQSLVRYTAQALLGQRKDLETKEIKDASRVDIAKRFGRTRLAPQLGIPLDLATGKNVAGEDVGLEDAALSGVEYLAVRDIRGAIRDDRERRGSGMRGALLGSLALLGAGVSTFDSTRKAKTITDKQKQYINALANRAGVNEDDAATKLKGRKVSDLSMSDAAKLIEHLKGLNK